MAGSRFAVFLRFVSIYAVVFFLFIWGSLKWQPQFLPFRPHYIEDTIDTSLIAALFYAVLFVILSLLQQEAQENRGKASRVMYSIGQSRASEDSAGMDRLDSPTAPKTERMGLMVS